MVDDGAGVRVVVPLVALHEYPRVDPLLDHHVRQRRLVRLADEGEADLHLGDLVLFDQFQLAVSDAVPKKIKRLRNFFSTKTWGKSACLNK